MVAKQRIFCFQLHAEKENLLGGSFQVLEELNSTKFYASNGNILIFTHSYSGAVCSVDVLYQRTDTVLIALSLEVPINRSKIKWKQMNIGKNYQLFYRAGME